MKAITIREPWASLILSGKKTIETRTWRTHYRGDVLICVSARSGGPFAGKAIAIVHINDCRPMVAGDADAAYLPLYPRAWAWMLSGVRPIAPFPVKGKLGFFDVTLLQESSSRESGPARDR